MYNFDSIEFINLTRKPVIIAVIINIVLPMILSKVATDDEIKPPNGASSLSLKSQIMHMFVHHNQVKLSSSIIIAVIVSISVYLSTKLEF